MWGKIKLVLLGFLLVVSLSFSFALAQTSSPSPSSTATISDDQASQLGQTLMQQMMGASFTQTTDQIKSVMGSDFLNQMYVAMGKFGGTTAYSNTGIWSMMPIMMTMMMGRTGTNMMGNFGSGFGTTGTNMMGSFGSSFFALGWVFMIIIWLLIILGVIALVRYIANQGKGVSGKSALEILEERYARGEIDKKEFEEKKKELA